MFDGQTVMVVASGAGAVLALKYPDIPTVVVNDAYRLCPHAQIVYAADKAWWDANPLAMTLRGIKVTCSPAAWRHGMELVRDTGREGFDRDISAVRTGGNSGYQALHLTIHAKPRRILLVGYDMHGEHFFGRHQNLRNPKPEMLARWATEFTGLVGKAQIINCTPGSAINCFPRATLEECLSSDP